MPVTAPDLNATSRPPPSEVEAACAVRTLARTETFMPMNPATPESTAPIRKPTATLIPRKTASTTKSTIPTTPIVAYCRRR
ncbi:hypothetical protein NBEOAGPD_0657 [Methylobacterium gregans]|uniref:Uncharacterized protein n=1 Tax=Methylobacterium gregans TaxID=374424 RepID=A0AA37HM99_9HYPH|nr:hypothetical protein NBEOAGPD_0657 [Methylobacterium gregans]